MSACVVNETLAKDSHVNTKYLLLSAALVCPTLAHASNATVVSDMLSQLSWQADSAAPVVGIIGDSVKLADIQSGALDVGTCTYNNGCINVFDPNGGTSNFAGSTDSARRDAIKESILAWRALHTNATFEVGIAPSRLDTHFNNLLTQMDLAGVPILLPTWAPSTQTTLQTFVANHSIVFYVPLNFFGFSDNQVVKIGMYKTVSGTVTTYTAGDGGKFVAPGAGEGALGLSFDWGTKISPVYAAAAAAARTLGADVPAIDGASGAHFTGLSGSSSQHGLVIGTLTF